MSNMNITKKQCLLLTDRLKMSFRCDGMELVKLKQLWPSIHSKIPPEVSVKLKHHLDLVLSTENDERIPHLNDFIRCCFQYKPTNFTEFVAYAMIATAVQLSKSPSLLFRPEKSRLMTYVFSTNVEFWAHNEDTVSKSK